MNHSPKKLGPSSSPGGEIQRLRIEIEGTVQGVGFRPFVYRLAHELGLTGWVNNSTEGVTIEIEGRPRQLDRFVILLARDKPLHSTIQNQRISFTTPSDSKEFRILPSSSAGTRIALVLPDIAVCPDCLREIHDPSNRRFRYPFTNCTNCGPRYSILEALPYDRPNTTMRDFAMCRECRAEYENPRDRRFHAQPNACPKCGPHLELWDRYGQNTASHDSALSQACKAIRDGIIVAVKGLGGFHLIVDARNDGALELLRERKHRDQKPFALMYPSLASVERTCKVSELERRVLQSAEAPIVLLLRKASTEEDAISSLVAPGNPTLGVMLPYTPLHSLMLAELGFPVVATSGNLADEPICIDEHEALERLGDIADLFLVHNRPIHTHLDDSVVRVVAGREMIMRRARGYAPLPIRQTERQPQGLAVGPHQKNTVAISTGNLTFLSQHIGDLDTTSSLESFDEISSSLSRLYELKPQFVAHDLHPDYPSSHRAKAMDIRRFGVQHHHAHILSCMADNELNGVVLGVAWDGTGYGTDGTIWGGEFLRVEDESFSRLAHFRTFLLPGGDAAMREPRRSAISLLWEISGGNLAEFEYLEPVRRYSRSEKVILEQMLESGIHCPETSSAGRLFDAVSSLLGICQITSFEGQAAMALEHRTDKSVTTGVYPFTLSGEGPSIIIDWEPMIREMIEDAKLSQRMRLPATKFHNTMAEIIVAVARRTGMRRVALSGGCFQNKYLTEAAVDRLTDSGFETYWHRRIPPNDGGISVGQIVAACKHFKREAQNVPGRPR